MTYIKWTGGSPEAAMQQVVFPQVRDNVAARLRSVRCPEHGMHPTSVLLSGHSLDSLSWRVEGCCDRLIQAARHALR